MKSLLFKSKVPNFLAQAKKSKFIILGLVLISASELDAYRILKYHRARNRCGIGCSSVVKDKELITYTVNGKAVTGWDVRITCSGNGVSHCPRMVESGTNLEIWSESTYESLSNYAQQQIDGGINSGNSTHSYTLPDGEVRILKVSWNCTTDAASDIFNDINIDDISDS